MEYRWLNNFSQQFLSSDYLAVGQSVDDRVNIICDTAETRLKKTGFAKKLKTNIQKGWYSLSTPIWTNFGTSRGLPISCYGSYISDTMESILYTAAEVGMMSKLGGGTSATFSNLRGRGEPITNNGFSSGAVHFAQIYDKLTGIISQGSARRGSFAGYLSVEHKDILEFLTIKSEGSPIQDISFGVCIPPGWMQSMIDGDLNKRNIWAKILESRTNKGYPYIVFLDNVNNNTVDVYKDKKLKITHSNLCCVTGDQIVKTSSGYFTVKELYDQSDELVLFDGQAYVLSSKMNMISNHEDVYKITLFNGMTHNVTWLHKVKTWDGMKPLSDLSFGNKVQVYTEEKGLHFSPIKSIAFIGYEPVYCPEVYTDNHVWVCNGFVTHNSEILLPDNKTESFVCDLASKNILYYDEWKNDPEAIEIIVYLLNAVMDEFIEKASDIQFMERTVKFAKRHRALGLGWLGWHSYLQSKMIPWESIEAKSKNIEIAKHINNKAWEASKKYAEEYGKPELLKDYDRANTTLTAIAPTKSSSFILGQVSEGIEPIRSNYSIKDLAKGRFSIRNPFLEQLLEQKYQNTDEIWDSIIMKSGSVQHLDFLTKNEKDVFKTFAEISPMEIIIQATARQKYVDQGQSLNLMIHPSIPIKDVNKLLIEGWKLGIKTYYYQLSVNAAQEFAREILACSNCES